MSEQITLEGKLEEIVKSIESMTVLELSQLVKGLEQRLGVSAAAPMAMMAAAPAGGAPAAAAEKTEFTVVLAGAGGGRLDTGRYVQHGTKPLSNLFLTMADHLGVQNLERFGDSNGRLGNV